MDFEHANEINQAIRTIAIRHRALADRLLGALGIYTGQEMVLWELGSKGACTPGHLATASGCEPPTITRSVRKLEDAGLVTRWPSPDDRRVTLIALTDRGKEVVAELPAVWQQTAEQTVAGLSGTSLDELIGVLTDLSASLAATHGAKR